MNRSYEIIGVPTSAGAHGPGQEKAPAALRRAGLIEALRASGVQVQDGGDLPISMFRPDPANRRAQSAARVVDVARQVADRVEAIAQPDRIPLVLGGDCTLTLGVISGLLRAWDDDLGLLYFDGDIDLNTPDISMSGILDNMGVAHLIGLARSPLAEIGPRKPLLSDEQIVLFGYDPGEQEVTQMRLLNGRAIHQFPSTEIDDDPAAGARVALAELRKNARRIVLHFDVDVIDTTELPLADFPHFNSGLSLEEAMIALRVFVNAPELAAVTITEINPDHDPDGTLLRDFVTRVAAAFRPS